MAQNQYFLLYLIKNKKENLFMYCFKPVIVFLFCFKIKKSYFN